MNPQISMSFDGVPDGPGGDSRTVYVGGYARVIRGSVPAAKPAAKVKPVAAPTADDLARMAENLRHQETADNDLTETAAIDLNMVKTLMAPGEWWTLSAPSRKVGAATQTVSARLRDLRKPRYGRNTVERRKTAVRGVFEYRLILAKPEATDADS